MISENIASITDAMRYLINMWEQRCNYREVIALRLLMHKLMGLRTFLLCLKRLDTEDTSFTYPSVGERTQLRLKRFLRETEYNSDTESSVEELQEPDFWRLKSVQAWKTFRKSELQETESKSSVEEVPDSDIEEPKEDNDSTEASQALERLLERLKSYVCDLDHDRSELFLAINCFEEEIDEWYTSLSNYLPQASSSPVANEVEEIFSSVLRNLEDFLSLHTAYVGVFVAPVEALKVIITFWRNFLRFVTFLGADQQQEFLDFLTDMEALAFSAAHFTVHIFSDGHYNVKVFSEDEMNLRESYQHYEIVHEDSDTPSSPDALSRPEHPYEAVLRQRRSLYAYSSPRHSYESCYNRVKSTVSALILRINPHDNPHLYESYTEALESLKSSRVPNLDMKESTALLLSILWEVLQFQTGPAVALKDKLQEMYEGFRYLRVLLKKHPDKFDGEVGAITRAGIFDAGVIILSVYQNRDAVSHGVEEFLGMMKVIRTEVEEQVEDKSKFRFPKTTLLAFLDFLLNYLMEVESSNVDANTSSCIREHLLFLRSFMEKLVKLKDRLENFHQAVWNFVLEVAYKIELLIDQMELGDVVESDSMLLQSITEDMQIIMTDSVKIFNDRVEKNEKTSMHTDQLTTESSIPSSANEFVGFEDERKSIIDRLTRGSKKLQVVAIVGMPGLGKTTLATRVYNEPSVQQHFHVRAWCTISQEFSKRKVLVELLNQIRVSKSNEPGADYSNLTEEELAQELRRSLLRRRYLIYVDDVWEIQAFECFKLSFPDDSFGRILLTSRIGDVAKLDDQPHFLRQMTFSESLELLQMKASPGIGWPPTLYDIAVKIAENCKGLPLITIIVAGLLGTRNVEVWEEVLENLTSGIISSTDQCQRTIELSYKHLPEHLKPCFLSFGAFLEDEEISVKKLIWLWIAEGFVRKTDSRSSEEVAADYLRNLIGRSLVMNSQKRNGGRIKTCRIHDLLLDFCLRKANEENDLHLLNGGDEILHFEQSHNFRRLSVHAEMKDFMESKLFYPRLRSLSFFGPKYCPEVTDISFIFWVFKLLRVLNMEKVKVSSFDLPGELGLLIRLRYLAITVSCGISPSIGNLSNLETFIIDPIHETLVTMPDTFWNLQKMRHLYLLQRHHGIILPVDNVDSSCKMLELDSSSGLNSKNWGMMEKTLRKFPNIRRLKFWLSTFGSGSEVMSFSFLSQLESLTLSLRRTYFTVPRNEFEFIFPECIKQLNLSGCVLPWERISRIAELPNLEVLKLLNKCFIGDKWQMEEGGFSKLRFLKLEGLDVVNWTGCDDQFPNLEKLVVEECDELEEIPECLENVDTLERIEVLYCSDRAVCLFENLADYLKDMGNSVLQFHVEKVPTSEPGSADEEDDDATNDNEEEYYAYNEEDSADGEDEDSVNEEDA